MAQRMTENGVEYWLAELLDMVKAAQEVPAEQRDNATDAVATCGFPDASVKEVLILAEDGLLERGVAVTLNDGTKFHLVIKQVQAG
jgi:hypothetical protein